VRERIAYARTFITMSFMIHHSPRSLKVFFDSLDRSWFAFAHYADSGVRPSLDALK
jgi:hypothetical protein